MRKVQGLLTILLTMAHTARAPSPPPKGLALVNQVWVGWRSCPGAFAWSPKIPLPGSSNLCISLAGLG